LNILKSEASMTSTFKEIKNRAITLLRPKERAELAHELISSLEKSHDSEIENAWDKEIKRRVLEIRNGTVKGRPAENVLAEIRAKYS
jgi:putative addiction module component (TIGR02574 family)